jgi:C-terminal processing protease CtpA/Prc
MRRFRTLLVAAGLLAAPAGALADEPSRPAPQTQIERFEWSTSKGRLGAMVIGVTPELRRHLGASDNRGVLVARVDAGSPASLAGIQVGDLIVEVHGRAIDGAPDVLSAVSDVRKGQSIDVRVVRDRKPLTLRATLTNDPMPRVPSSRWLRNFMKPFDESWFDRWFEQPAPPSHDT